MVDAQKIAAATTQIVDMSLNQRFLRYLRTGAIAATLLVMILSVVDIVGWVFDIPVIKRPIEYQASLQAATAVNFLLAMISLLLLQTTKSRPLRILAKVLGGLVALVGLANFIEHVFELDFGLAIQLCQPKDAVPLTYPGPIAPDVALNFLLFGTALALFDYRMKDSRRIYPYQVIALLLAVPNIMILFAFSSGMHKMCAYTGCVRFSPITSALLSIAYASLFFAKPERSFVNIYARNSIGGRIIRNATVCLLAGIPFAMLVELGQNAGLYEESMSMFITLTLMIGALIACAAFSARNADIIQADKSQALELLQDSFSSLGSYTQRKLKRVCLECCEEYDENTELEKCPKCGEELELIADSLKPGSMFADRYEIKSLLGVGGISTVYLVRHLYMEKELALKLIHAQFATDTKYVQRFKREAKTMSKLAHPNIVGVADFGISLDGEAYLVMEYLQGESLAERAAETGKQPWLEAVPLFMGICEGLIHAHTHGIIHRDLKPGNVMLVPDEIKGTIPKVVDFGMAKGSDMSGDLTRTGDLLGSPAYMSPEQCSGRADVDARSDIYAMGALMYDVLVGHPPIIGATITETLLAHQNRPPEPIPKELNVPQWLEKIIIKALAKNVDDRHQCVAEMYDELEEGMQVETALIKWSSASKTGEKEVSTGETATENQLVNDLEKTEQDSLSPHKDNADSIDSGRRN